MVQSELKDEQQAVFEAESEAVQEAVPGPRWLPSLVHTSKMLDLSRKVETHPERYEASVSWKTSSLVRPSAMLAVLSLTLACTCATLRVNNMRQRASPVGVSQDRRFLPASRDEPFEEQEAGLLFSH
jgi:hypothetical protein